MPTLADYMVLLDGGIEIDASPGEPGDLLKLSFTLPAAFTVGANLAKPLLAFIMNPRSGSVRVGFWVNPEGPAVQLLQSTQEDEITWHNADHVDYALWEAIHGNRFKKGGENTIFFKSWEGHVRIRDVVLWYQRQAGG